MWSMIQFLLESFIFMLVGLELPYVLHALRSQTLVELIGDVIGRSMDCRIFSAANVAAAAQHVGGTRKPATAARRRIWCRAALSGWSGRPGAQARSKS